MQPLGNIVSLTENKDHVTQMSLREGNISPQSTTGSSYPAAAASLLRFISGTGVLLYRCSEVSSFTSWSNRFFCCLMMYWLLANVVNRPSRPGTTMCLKFRINSHDHYLKCTTPPEIFSIATGHKWLTSVSSVSPSASPIPHPEHH